MCGTDDVYNADIFANLVSEGEGECQAAVYAYKAPMTAKANGKKLADDTGLGAQFGIEEVLSQARKVKHVPLWVPLDLVGSGDGASKLSSRFHGITSSGPVEPG